MITMLLVMCRQLEIWFGFSFFHKSYAVTIVPCFTNFKLWNNLQIRATVSLYSDNLPYYVSNCK